MRRETTSYRRRHCNGIVSALVPWWAAGEAALVEWAVKLGDLKEGEPYVIGKEALKQAAIAVPLFFLLSVFFFLFSLRAACTSPPGVRQPR